jgi:hypothetical protein
MAQLKHLVKKLLNENCRSEMLEKKNRFVGMIPTMQPPCQLLSEDSSPEKVVKIFKLRI